MSVQDCASGRTFNESFDPGRREICNASVETRLSWSSFAELKEVSE